jgi:hypothetical protein
MSNAYKICKEFTGNSFDYGSTEEVIGFIFDNYYVAMRIYRAIVKQQKEIEQIREDAHNDLQKLRDAEDRWKRTDKLPNDFNSEEHEKRKNHLVEIREAHYQILYNGVPIESDKLGSLVYKNMKMFKVLNKIDSGTRNVLGPLAKKSIRIAIWPMRKMIQLTEKDSKNTKEKEFLKKMESFINGIPEQVESKIIL